MVLLVVERDKHIRDFLRDFLSKLRCTIVFADDGTAALELVKSLRPALVITEILVPKLDGLALCRAIKFTPATSDIPVLVLTMLDAGARAKLAGADAVMMKPLAEAPLLELIERVAPALRAPLRPPEETS
jgi:CheY-like chemotaxis protein